VVKINSTAINFYYLVEHENAIYCPRITDCNQINESGRRYFLNLSGITPSQNKIKKYGSYLNSFLKLKVVTANINLFSGNLMVICLWSWFR
jgi:hypothetical protein